MKVLTFSRYFPKGHPKAGQPTQFVEKIWNCFRRDDYSLSDSFKPWIDNVVKLNNGPDWYLKAIKVNELKHHTIRAGNRFKPGDMASLRVWSDKPRRSKQIEFTQVEVKKTWAVEIWINKHYIEIGFPVIPGKRMNLIPLCDVVKNDGLDCNDFVKWFMIHPKKQGNIFNGQIITWSDSIEY